MSLILLVLVVGVLDWACIYPSADEVVLVILTRSIAFRRCVRKGGEEREKGDERMKYRTKWS